MSFEQLPTKEGPWNPGLNSEIPHEYLPLSTIFRNENVSTTIEKAQELSNFCGLPITELVAFRAERLIIHELLIHVTTSLSVPDGGDYEDLGRNFRQIASTILDRYIAPHREELVELFERFSRTASAVINREIARTVAEPARPDEDRAPRWRHRLFGPEAKITPPPFSLHRTAERDRLIASDWSKRATTASNRLDAGCLDALRRIATGVMTRHGRLVSDKALLSELALTLVCNDYGSEVISDAIMALVQEAASQERYGQLPRQEEPVVMNVKGASASGKSTMRPLQRILARKLNLRWEEFALISPDIWRKFLLDYASLGPAYKYAAMLTGHELEIIDRKLDRRMKAKAKSREIPHLLIDRFRFDSFVPELEGKGSHRLLTRFGTLVYMFFLITPPEMTVERAWKRALKVGRYKAVEDLLAHNVEAFTGMPELFFTWALAKGKRVHYEFLDNSVPEGQPPRTVAFGWNGEMTILDIKGILDIDRFRKINIRASNSNEVYLGVNLKPEYNIGFLKRCIRWIPIINFADFNTGHVYGRLEHGKWTWRDEKKFSFVLNNLDPSGGIEAIAPDNLEARPIVNIPDLVAEKGHTMGAWGESLL